MEFFWKNMIAPFISLLMTHFDGKLVYFSLQILPLKLLEKSISAPFWLRINSDLSHQGNPNVDYGIRNRPILPLKVSKETLCLWNKAITLVKCLFQNNHFQETVSRWKSGYFSVMTKALVRSKILAALALNRKICAPAQFFQDLSLSLALKTFWAPLNFALIL